MMDEDQEEFLLTSVQHIVMKEALRKAMLNVPIEEGFEFIMELPSNPGDSNRYGIRMIATFPSIHREYLIALNSRVVKTILAKMGKTTLIEIHGQIDQFLQKKCRQRIEEVRKDKVHFESQLAKQQKKDKAKAALIDFANNGYGLTQDDAHVLLDMIENPPVMGSPFC